MGPSASAGKKLRAPTTMITAMRRPTKRGPSVRRVPALSGMSFLAGQRARDGQHGKHHPVAADQHDHAETYVVEAESTLSPAKALPLLPGAEENA